MSRYFEIQCGGGSFGTQSDHCGLECDAVQCSEHPDTNTSHSHHRKKIFFLDFQRLTASDSCFKAPQ